METDWTAIIGQVVVVLLGILASHFGLRRHHRANAAEVDKIRTAVNTVIFHVYTKHIPKERR